MSGREYLTALRWWTGDEVYREEYQCPICKEAVCDKLGVHSLTCTGAGSMARRHYAIVSVLFAAASSANLRPKKEVAIGGILRPADILTTELGRRVANDICCVHPLHGEGLKRTLVKGEGSVQAAYEE